MDFLLLAAAFLVGILIRPALVALARGETINFSMNFKYFGFRLRIGCHTHRPSQLSAMTPHLGTRLVPQLGPPPLSRALLAVSDPPNIDSRSAPCLLPGHDWDAAAPGRALGSFQSTGRHRTNPVHRAVRAGDSAKMPKRKPAPEEEPKKAIIIYEKSREETTPGDEPKKETNSWESRHGTNHGDKPIDGDNPEDDPKDGDNPGKNRNAIGAVIGATVGAGVALVGLPVCIGTLGFTGAGIAAGSVAAKMMSAAAIANGGGVAAGSAVAVLQSIGAAGLSLGAKVGLTSALSSAGAASGAWLSKQKKPPSDKPKKR